jgi:hypothetical protein
MDELDEIEIDAGQAEAIARGLFALARVDGVHERELALIASFYSETGSPRALAELEKREPIGAAELAAALPGAGHRKLFMKTAFLLAWADGVVTSAERTLIEQYAGALGVAAADLAHLEDSVKDVMIGQIAHLQNTDATRQVAAELKI